MTAAEPTTGPARRVCEQDWPDDSPPTVSVICAAFNQEAFVGQCLDGILRQLVSFPVEVIVHDDASTDGTPAVIQDYARRYPKLIRTILQTENQHSRFRKARPIMLSQARGEFIADCDGDDIWTDPHKLEKQVAFLRENRSFVMSFHDAVPIDTSGKQVDTGYLPEEARRDYTQAELRVLKWGWILMGTAMHRNVELDFPPEYFLAPNGDNFVPMLLAAFGAAKFQPEVGPLARRLHRGSMWASKSQAEQNRMHLQTYLQIAGYFVRTGDIKAARKILAGRLSLYVRRYLGLAGPPGR